MIGLFRLLFIFGIIYVIYKFLTQYVFPLLLGNFINRNFSHMQGNHSANDKQYTRREGEVTINDANPRKNRKNKNAGEYVDFEEIK
jgi:hypothetical protein